MHIGTGLGRRGEVRNEIREERREEKIARHTHAHTHAQASVDSMHRLCGESNLMQHMRAAYVYGV